MAFLQLVHRALFLRGNERVDFEGFSGEKEVVLFNNQQISPMPGRIDEIPSRFCDSPLFRLIVHTGFRKTRKHKSADFEKKRKIGT